MEQATSETEPVITEEASAEPSVAARKAATSQEEPDDQEQIDYIRYDSRMSNTTYPSSHKTGQKASKGSAAKKSPTKGGLEKVISNIEIEAERLLDGTLWNDSPIKIYSVKKPEVSVIRGPIRLCGGMHYDYNVAVIGRKKDIMELEELAKNIHSGTLDV